MDTLFSLNYTTFNKPADESLKIATKHPSGCPGNRERINEMIATNSFDIVLDSMEMEPEEFEKKYGAPQISPHGKLVKVKWMAYGDLYIYEDGYEEYISIGD